MSDTATIISSICGVIVATIGGGRMLMSYWFRMQERLRKQDQTIKQMEIAQLKSLVDSLKDQIRSLQADIKAFNAKVDILSAKIRSNEENAERVIQAQQAFIGSTEKRFKALEMELERVGTVIVKAGAK